MPAVPPTVAVVVLLAIAGLLAYALRPAAGQTRVRTAVIRTAVLLGALGVLTVEAASAANALTAATVAAVWAVTLVGAGAAAAVRHRRAPTTWRPRVPGRQHPWLVAAVGGILSATLLIAVLGEPNTHDSLTYHLPRIEHWVANGSVSFYPTEIHRQITMSPGHEYLLTHLRLLTGGNGAYNVTQWAAAAGCALAASRIAAQLGGECRAQMLTALVVLTAPMVVMHASGTQNDLVVAAWVACVATLVLDGVRRRATAGEVALLALAAGLVAITKNNGLVATGPLLLWWGIAQLRLAGRDVRRIATTIAAGTAILAGMAVLTGPFTARMIDEFGTALGPPVVRENVPMQRHDPASVVVNAVRIALTSMDTPVDGVREFESTVVDGLARGLGLDPRDPKTQYKDHVFPAETWQPVEDLVSFPVQAALAFVAVGWALSRRRELLRGYAVAVLASGVLFAALIKWQPWVNRLVLFLLVLAAPVAGVWLARLCTTEARRAARAFGVVALVGLLVTGAAAVAVGHPRGLAGRGSVFVGDDLHKALERRSELEADYRWVAERVAATGEPTVGLVQWPNDFEYPWWWLLPERRIVSLTSVLDNREPAPVDSVRAVICTTERWACERVVPPTWRLEYRRYAGYAVPP